MTSGAVSDNAMLETNPVETSASSEFGASEESRLRLAATSAAVSRTVELKRDRLLPSGMIDCKDVILTIFILVALISALPIQLAFHSEVFDWI